jgi:uncharacterized protein YukE
MGDTPPDRVWNTTTKNFFLEPDALARVTRVMQGDGFDLGDALGKLNGVLDEHDGCWGDDAPGKAFAKSYVDPANQALSDSKDGVQAIEDTVDNLNQASAAFQSVDYDQAVQMDLSVGDDQSS